MRAKATDPRAFRVSRDVGRVELNVGADQVPILQRFFAENKDKPLSVDFAKWTKKRSLDANSYAWVLIDKIASALHGKKIDVYRNAIREIGGNSDVLTMRTEAFEPFARRWESNGDGWQAEVISEAKTPGYTHVRAYYGSSVYDTDQMSNLIDVLIQDAKELGIETLPPDELERMVGQWQSTDKQKPPT